MRNAQQKRGHPQSNVVVNTLYHVARTFPKVKILSSLFRKVYSWYESGWPVWSNGDFSYLPALIQDARWDINFVTRRETMRRMRYWSQNSAIIEACLSVGERYTVGASGLHVAIYPDEDLSEDADNSWYERAEMVLREWEADCGWNGESMTDLLKIGYRCQKTDGEIFYVKTRKAMPLALDTRTLQVQKPCLQMVEAHRCESPWNRFEQEGDSLVDGVQFDKSTQAGIAKYSKLGYWMRAGLSSFEQNDSWEFVKADEVWHLYNQYRVNQFRGISDFFSCCMDINKLEDLLEIELKAAATQSFRAVAIKNKAGAASPVDPRLEMVNAWRGKGQPPLPNSQTPESEQQLRRELYRKENGAYTYFLKENEDVLFDTPTRPSQSTLNLWEFLVNEICAGAKIPRCLIMQKISGESARSQGTEVRAELSNGNLFFKGDFQKWKCFRIESAIWFLSWAIKNDPRLADPPADWKNCLHVEQSEACDVDVAYSTQADVTRLASGLTSYHLLLGQQGLSAVTVFKQLSREQKLAEKLGIKLTLPALLKGEIQLTGEKPEQEKEAANA